jgi:carboxylesterase
MTDLSKYHRPFSNISNSDVGILVIHGFTSTTSSMMYIAERFAEQKYNVELPPLSGHGGKWDDLAKVSYQDWINDVENAYQKLKKRAKYIFVCGLSLGGALTLRLAELHNDIAGIILINNALIFTNPKFWFVPLIKNFIPYVKAIGGDLKDPDAKEITYDKTSIKAVNEMLKLLKLVKTDIKNVKAPALIFKSKQDHVVPIKSAVFTYENIGSEKKELIFLDNSYHVATLDYDKSKIVDLSIKFIEKTVKHL